MDDQAPEKLEPVEKWMTLEQIRLYHTDAQYRDMVHRLIPTMFEMMALYVKAHPPKDEAWHEYRKKGIGA